MEIQAVFYRKEKINMPKAINNYIYYFQYQVETLNHYLLDTKITTKEINKICRKIIKLKNKAYLAKEYSITPNIWKYQSPTHNTIYKNSKGFFIETPTKNLFSIKYTSNRRLYNLKDTIAFINNPINQCVIDNNTINNLIEIYTIHKEGLILFKNIN